MVHFSLSKTLSLAFAILLAIGSARGEGLLLAAHQVPDDDPIYKEFYSFEETREQVTKTISSMGMMSSMFAPKTPGVDTSQYVEMLIELVQEIDAFAMNGGSPHSFSAIQVVPAETDLVISADFRLDLLLDTIRRVAGKPGREQISAGLEMGIMMAGQTLGIDFDKTIRSIAGPYTLIVRLHPTERLKIPTEKGGTLDFPLPEVVLSINVAGNDLFDVVTKSMEKAKLPVSIQGSGGVQKMVLPTQTTSYAEVTPLVATNGSTFVLATSENYLDRLFVKKGASDLLVNTSQFKEITDRLPQEGNNITYMSPRFTNEVAGLAEHGKDLPPSPVPGFDPAMLEKWGGILREAGSVGMVRANEPKGVWIHSTVPIEDFSNLGMGENLFSGMTPPTGGQPDMQASANPKSGPSKMDITWQGLDRIEMALERYKADNGKYPPSSGLKSILNQGPQGNANMAAFAKLKEPVDYIDVIPLDPYAKGILAPYYYYCPTPERDQEIYAQGILWIVWSVGPDGVCDIKSTSDFESPERMAELVYDAGKGPNSPGDIVNAVVRD